ncbi:MAG: hypothetical protein Q7T20_11535 [Saprospiraceae bacterium]|nr:hypothetical protein [Saprospiraceae bacterium]
MRNLITSLIFVLTINIIDAQSITGSYLQIYSKPTAVTPVINAGKGPDGTDNSFSFSYEHFIKNKRYSIVSSYTRFNGCTLIYFEEGGWIGRGGTPISGYGFCGGVKVHRFDIGASSMVRKEIGDTPI